MHAEAYARSRLLGAPFIATFGMRFVDWFDPVFGKMVLEKCCVEVASAVLVANSVDRSEGGRTRGESGKRVDDFVQQANGDVGESGAFGAVVVDEIVELGWIDQAGTDEQRADIGRLAGAGKTRFEASNFDFGSIEWKRAVVVGWPTVLFMVIGRICITILDDCGPAGGRLLHRAEDCV